MDSYFRLLREYRCSRSRAAFARYIFLAWNVSLGSQVHGSLEQILFAFDRLPETAPEHRMVIRDDHAYFSVHGPLHREEFRC
jgi:hypothetical protein